jgi:hypothetical protein
MTDPNRPPRMPSTNSFQIDPEDVKSRAHPLKLCSVCNNEADPMGGVEVRSKWYCAKCWVKFIGRR